MVNPGELVRYAGDIETAVWRLSSSSHTPMTPAPRRYQGAGRFDDPTIGSTEDTEGFSVMYCADSAKVVFLEILAGLRPGIDELRSLVSPVVAEVAEKEILSNSPGLIPERWRETWQLSLAEISLRYPIFDLTNPGAIQLVREQLAVVIYAFGISDVDFSTVLGSDRRITQAISRWVWAASGADGEPLFAGIRYRSRIDVDSSCLALFEGRFDVASTVETFALTPQTPGFAEAASILRLQIA